MKRTIKIVGLGAMSLFLMLLSFSSYSQSCPGNSVTVSLQNFTQTATEVEFDVYIMNTGTTSMSLIALAGGININNGFIPEGGTATFTCISQPGANAFLGFTPLITAPVSTEGPFANHIRWTESPVSFSSAVAMQAGADMKFGRFKITSSMPWTADFPGTLDILNMTSGPLTKINAVVYCSSNTNSTALNSDAPGTMPQGVTSNYILNPTGTLSTTSLLGADLHATSVYPNPATDKLSVEIFIESSNEKTAVRLLDMSGRLVREVSVQTKAGLNTIELNMRDIVDGMYTVMVYQNGKLLHTDKVKKK